MSRRRIPIVAAIATVLIGGLAIAVLAAPVIGASFVRERVLPRLEERLGRRISVATVRVRLSRVELDDFILDGAGGAAPIVAPRVIVRVRMLSLLRGQVRLGRLTLVRPRITVVRTEHGDDNVSTIIERLRRERRAEAEDAASPAPRPSRMPDELEIIGGSLKVEEDTLGTVEVGALDLLARRDGAGEARIGDVDAHLAAGPGARARALTVRFSLANLRPVGLPAIEVDDGEVKVWKGFALSGIRGGFTPAVDEPTRVDIDLRGGYGGVAEVLWSARGQYRTDARTGDLKLIAERFDLGKLAPILKDTPFVDPERAQVDADLVLRARPDPVPPWSEELVMRRRVAGEAPVAGAMRDVVEFEGRIRMAGLSIHEPRLTPQTIRDFGFEAKARGLFDPRGHAVRLDSAALDVGGVKAELSLSSSRLGRKAIPGKPIFPLNRSWALPVIRADLKVPPVPCQMVLAALPPALVPALHGFRLSGSFESELHLAIDPEDLDALELGGDIGIDGCKVTDSPAAYGASRLLSSFDQAVEIEPGNWIAFDVGPLNPDWTPLKDVSPHIVNSLMTTEDSNFFHHKGFIGREFRSALKTNLERGYFRLGASSITMQMVKNVLLSREKTLSRKLQELFLTWDVERTLSKGRILEVYLNVIEFGPGIYGIGRAARHYFGKPARDLGPREAAFFSSILPNPKRRYTHYCHGAPEPKWELYLNRILRVMHARHRLTDEEYARVVNERLTFDRAEAQPEAKCMEMVRRLAAQQKGQGGEHAGVPVHASEAATGAEAPEGEGAAPGDTTELPDDEPPADVPGDDAEPAPHEL